MAVDSSYSNRLAKEKSPYLLQHAHNPVDWYPWGEEAFEKAKKEDKPVFLSIGYSTCHWCHVMEDESFSDVSTASALNKDFVAIKVDREERPDIDSVYMSYVMAATGSGGWPMSVFLTPDKKPFYGGTYFPPEDRYGMSGFKTLLGSIAESWRSERKNILDAAGSAASFLSTKTPVPERTQSLTLKTLEQAFLRFKAGYDEEYAGFGRAPKFPRSHSLSFLLRYWLKSGNAEALSISEKTLEAMAAGGMYDQLGGGFHRYSTDALWRIPHFEKMLYDQALLVLTYLEAYQATGNAEYARIARETLDYVLREMTSPEGGFYSAEDADSEDPHKPGSKREGAFYVWTKKEIERVLGSDAPAFCAYYGITEGGNAISDPHNEFKNQNVLYRAQSQTGKGAGLSPKGTGATPPGPEERVLPRDRFALARKKLFEFRSKRPRPYLDDKILTDWNGLMIAAMARGAIILDEARYRAAAQKAAEFLDQKMKDPSGRLFHRYRGKDAGIPANLNDHAFLILGYLQVYEMSFDPRWIKKASALADAMIELFQDTEGGGFYLTARDAEVLISRPKEVYDGALPSGNSAAALALAYLGRYTGESRYENEARGTLDAFSEALSADPANYPFMLMALDLELGPSREVVIAAGERGGRADLFIMEVQKPFFPNQVVLLNSDEWRRGLESAAAFVSDKLPLSGKTAVYICRDHVCALPVTELDELKRSLKQPVQK